MAPSAAKTNAAVATSNDFKDVPRFYKRKNGILLYFLLTPSFLCSFAAGFDGVSCTTELILNQDS